MTVDSDTFRSVLGRFASGVTVVTALDASGRDHGMTVSALCSVSLNPPQLLVCIGLDASMHDTLAETDRFAVSVLSAGQEALSRRFAEEEVGRFDGIGYTRSESGLVLLDDALAHIECRVMARHRAGDHTIVVGEVEHAAAGRGQPLLYYRGGYAQFER